MLAWYALWPHVCVCLTQIGVLLCVKLWAASRLLLGVVNKDHRQMTDDGQALFIACAASCNNCSTVNAICSPCTIVYYMSSDCNMEGYKNYKEVSIR